MEADARAAIAMAASENVGAAQGGLEQLKMLAWRPGAEHALLNAGTLDATVEAMRRHASATSVQLAGAGTLTMLCLEDADRCRAAVAAGAPAVLVAAVLHTLDGMHRMQRDASARLIRTWEKTFAECCACLAAIAREDAELQEACFAAGAHPEWLLLQTAGASAVADEDDDDADMRDSAPPIKGEEEHDDDEEDATPSQRMPMGLRPLG